MESPQTKMTETYLGDGVYATFDGWNIVLDLRAQGPEKICLEPEVLHNLYKFAKSLGWKGDGRD
jgi:hypothetical protein